MTRLPKQYAKILYELLKDLPKEKEKDALRAFTEFLHREGALLKSTYILEEFETYAKAQEGIATLSVTTARELNQSELEDIKRVFGERAEITTTVDANVLGGIKMTTGDLVIDGTVQTKLRLLATSLTA